MNEGNNISSKKVEEIINLRNFTINHYLKEISPRVFNSSETDWISKKINARAREVIKPLYNLTDNLDKYLTFMSAKASKLMQKYVQCKSELRITKAILEDSRRRYENLTKLNSSLSIELAQEKKKTFSPIHITPKTNLNIEERVGSKSMYESIHGSLDKEDDIKELKAKYKAALKRIQSKAMTNIQNIYKTLNESLNSNIKYLTSITNSMSKGKLAKQTKVFELKLATLQWKCNPLHRLRKYYEKWFNTLKEIIDHTLEQKLAPVNYICGQVNMLHAIHKSDSNKILQLTKDVEKRNNLVKTMKKIIDKKAQELKSYSNKKEDRKIGDEHKKKLLDINRHNKNHMNELYQIKVSMITMTAFIGNYTKRLEMKCRESTRSNMQIDRDIESLNMKVQELENKIKEDDRVLAMKIEELNKKDLELAMSQKKVELIQKELEELILTHKGHIEKREKEYEEKINKLKEELKVASELAQSNKEMDNKLKELEKRLQSMSQEHEVEINKKNEELNAAQMTIGQMVKEVLKISKGNKAIEELKVAQSKITELENKLKSGSDPITEKRELKNAQKRISELEKQLKTTTDLNNSIIEKKDKEIKAFQTKINELQKQIKAIADSTQSTIIRKERELKNAQVRVTSLEKQLKDISDTNQAVLERRSKEIKTAQVKISELEKTLKESSTNRASIAKQSDELKAAQLKINKLEIKLSETTELNQLALKKKTEELKMTSVKLNDLEKKLKDTSKHTDNIYKNKEVKIKMEELKKSVKSMEKNISRLDNQLIEKEAKIGVKAVKVKKPSDLAKEEEFDLSQEEDSFIGDIEISLISLKKIANSIKELKKTIQDSRSRLKELETINSQLKNKNKELELNAHNLSQTVLNLKEENNALRNKLELHLKNNATTNVGKSMVNKIDDLQKKLKDTEPKLSATNKLAAEKITEVNSLTPTSKAIEEKNTSEKKRLKEHITGLKQLIASIERVKNLHRSSLDKVCIRLEIAVRKLMQLKSRVKLTANTKKLMLEYKEQVMNYLMIRMRSIGLINLEQSFEGIVKRVNKLWEMRKGFSDSKVWESVKVAIANCVETVPLR